MSSWSGHSHTNIVITVTKLAEITNKIISIIRMIHTIFELNCLLKYVTGPKFLDARKFCCNLPKIQTKSPNLGIFRQKDANGIANSEDLDHDLGAV